MRALWRPDGDDAMPGRGPDRPLLALAGPRRLGKALVQAGRKSRAARTSSASLARCASGVMALPSTEVAKPH